MESQQVAEASAALSMDVKTQDQVEPEPQLANSPTEDKQSKKKRKKKKKNRRKSIERTQSEVEAKEEPGQDEGEAFVQDKQEEETLKALLQDNQDEEETPVKDNQEEAGSAAQAEVEAVKETAPSQPEEEDMHQKHEAAAGEGLGPPSLERQTSLDNLKATGTRAVGSLFSRFKVGRKKPLPSRTESAAKLELVNPSPVKTAVKKLEVPEEKSLDDLPVRTKRDFFAEGEQSIHVSAEKRKYDELDKQRQAEKEAEEAAKAARQTPPSSSRSNVDMLAHATTDKDAPDTETTERGLEPTETLESDDKSLHESVTATGEPATEISSLVITSTTAETVIEETIKPEDVAPALMTVDTIESSEASIESTAEPAATSLGSTEVTEHQATSVKVEDSSVAVSASRAAYDEQTQGEQPTDDASKLEPISLELDLDPDLKKDIAEAEVEEVASETAKIVTVPVEAAASNNKDIQSEDSLLLPVKVTPPTSELPVDAAEPAKPEKMSPVKSLASRFEGKREQSLDSLKFRTVREFFPEERSIRVGAEKQKYEAQAQQQKLKTKAEEEARSKYNTGSGFKSPDKEAVTVPASPELKAGASVAAVAPPVVAPLSGIADTVDVSTPDTAVGRKSFSFDEALANSPSKFSDEAPEGLTPVKSIASRFEGKREQSLDSLKFRTVREFFPEERSVRVGSEKQKFEAQAQQGNSLDNLKFRTVREFFPEEGKRSIHVGAEKAKYEALTKHQEEAKAAEQLKFKHAAPSPSLTAVKLMLETPEVASLTEATTEVTSVEEAAAVPELAHATSASTEAAVDKAVTEVKGSMLTDVASSAAEEGRGAAESEAADDTHVETNQLDDVENVPAVEPFAVTTNEVADCGVEVHDHEIKESVNVVETLDEQDKQVEHEPQEPAEEEIELKVEHEIVPEVKLEDEHKTAQEGALEPQHDLEKSAQETEETSVETQELVLTEASVDAEVETAAEITSHAVKETSSSLTRGEQNQESEQVRAEKADEQFADDGLVQLDLSKSVVGEQVESVAVVAEDTKPEEEVNTVDIPQPADGQDMADEAHVKVVESTLGGENRLVELDLGAPVVEKPVVDSSKQANAKSHPMLTTERSFVMEDDNTIETEDTVVVAERPMTDDEFEPLSSRKTQPDHELSSSLEASKKKELSSSRKPSTKSSHSSKTSPKLTRKVSAGSAGSMKSPRASTTVPVPMKRASITAPTASYMAKKAAEAEELHKKAAPQLKKRGSSSKLKGTVSDTGFIKPPPAAPTVPVPMKRASITAPTASWQARNIPEHTDKATESHHAPKTHASKPKGTVGPTGFVKPLPPPPTVPVAPKRASIMAPTASYMAKKAAEHCEAVDVAAPSLPARNKRYSNVKSKVLEGLQSGFDQTAVHKTITKEEYIAAERRKSFGAAGVKSVLDAVDRRASLTARVTIDGPPEPFIRSAESRKKLNSTVPRYMNYENSSGYAERARQQYERRKRLEEENAAKSEKRQKELRMFFAEQQQKAMKLSAEEVRRGMEAHEFTKLAKESEMAAQKALRKEKQRVRRTPHRALSATSASSSNGVTSRASKKSSVSSVEAKVSEPTAESPVVKTEEAIESVVVEEPLAEAPSPAEKEASAEVEEAVVETAQVEEQPIQVPLVDEDPALEHVAKKIDFDEASSDSDEKDVADV
jgi:hypothetical protein